MIEIRGNEFHNLYQAYLWLKEAWIYEPYEIYYEDECIIVEPNRGTTDDETSIIHNLKEFEKFMYNH